MPLKIGVLYGGRSEEREVSLKSGEAVFKGLLANNYEVVKIDTGKKNFVEEIKSANINLAFLALHGKYGEDGTIQGLLELLDIPYTGSGVLASAAAMNKIATKKLLLAENILTPNFYTYTETEFKNKSAHELYADLEEKISLPVVVKAPTQGSTIGITFVKNKEQYLPALEQTFKYDREILIEKLVSGTEITVTVMGNDDLTVLPQIEITSTTGIYDYQAKYTVGMSHHIIPPTLPESYLEETARVAQLTYKALGCRGIARVDFIVTPDGKSYVLEVNTLPGMTETSLVPDSAKALGWDFPLLLDKIVKLALENK